MQEYTLEPANFSDYRDFLKQRFLTLKGENKNFSLQSCAQKSQISKALLQFLLKKQRHISLDKVPGLGRGLKMTDEEEQFVYLMVCQASNKNPKIKAHFDDVLSRLRHQYVKTTELAPPTGDLSLKSLHQNSLFPILQTFTKIDGFREDPKWILENLFIKNLTKEKIASTLKELERLGHLERDADSRLISKDHFVYRPDPYDPKGFNVYSQIAASVAELMQDPGAFRPSVYSELSLSLDEENLLQMEKLMIETHHRLVALASNSKRPTAVAYIGNFFLTVARLKTAPVK